MLVKNQTYGRDLVMRNISLTRSTPDHLHLRSGGTEKGGEEQAFELIATDSRIFARESKTGNIWQEYETDPNPEYRQVGGVWLWLQDFLLLLILCLTWMKPSLWVKKLLTA